MPKSLSELLTEIETKAGAEVLEGVKAELHTLREEAKRTREAGELIAKQVKEQMKALGMQENESFDAFAKRQKSAVDALKGDADSKKSELEKLLERLQGVETQLKQTEEQRQAETKARKRKEVELLLQGELVKGNAAKDTLNILQTHLQGLIEESEGGLLMQVDGGKKPISEGVAAFLKANPRFVSEQQAAGSGGGGANAGGAKTDAGKLYAEGNSTSATNELVKAARARREGAVG